MRSIKFLFLPPEHDPDSFIRANGREAFARYVSEATPLSRFLIESARDGLDLNTAEGRAHTAARAFIAERGLPRVNATVDQDTVTRLADQAYAKEWRRYHDERAVLRMLSARANLSGGSWS